MYSSSVASTPELKYCTGNISNMYLVSLLEYVRFHYNFVNSRYIYAQINREWYILKQVGKITHNNLIQYLKKHGYVRVGLTNGLFIHKTRDISFMFADNGFGIKYQKKKTSVIY